MNMMRKAFVLLLFNSLFIHNMVSQDLVQRIEDTYNILDSISYIENIILSFRESVKEEVNDMNNLTLELGGCEYTKADSLQRQNIIDSIWGKPKYSNTRTEERTSWFDSIVNEKPVHYVLNLRVDSCEQSDKYIGMLPDSTNLPFSLFYFDKRANVKFFVLVDDGQISHYDSFYRTFSMPIGINTPKVFKKILRKNPKYLLYCYDLEQMNTILYMLNDKIYVFRITQMKEYELGDYIEAFLK